MKYVALLSGGKDSCFNLLHCNENGHSLIAAASLGPKTGKEELDSYLYQTVGQDAIEFVARALGVRLYRQVISGSAVEQGSEYGYRNPKNGNAVPGDETEDLYDLLCIVKSHHPDVKGVSVGAILSNYQRVRVEQVCRRLELTALCYLWQRGQDELLSEMIAAGMESVIIKVAGIGLTKVHLGKTLVEMQPKLVQLNHLYGAHICGEGGEYETFTVDCPLFSKRIILKEVETVIHSDNAFATVAYLRIKNATLEDKPSVSDVLITVPPILEDDFKIFHDMITDSSEVEGTSAPNAIIRETSKEYHEVTVSSRRIGSWVAVGNIQRRMADGHSHISVANEVEECFDILLDELRQYDLELSHCTNINIFLSDMSLFARVNSVYGTFFGVSPPARACVAVDLPSPIRVRLDCLAFVETKSSDRQALHVQSLSYWAPANIGPYSQAIIADEWICVSGQIGLFPSSLSLPLPQSLSMETALASQHVFRIVEALRSSSGGGWGGDAQLILYWLVNPQDVSRVRNACISSGRESDVPTLYLVVQSLPRGALVEKQVLLHTGRCSIVDDDEEHVTVLRKPVVEAETFFAGQNLRWEVSYFEDSRAACAVIYVQSLDQNLTSLGRDLVNHPRMNGLLKRTLSVRLFYGEVSSPGIAFYHILFPDANRPPVTCIPCRLIASREMGQTQTVIRAVIITA